MTESSNGGGWSAQIAGRTLSMALSGDWTTSDRLAGVTAAAAWLDRPEVESMAFDARALGHWDSSLLVFLTALRARCVQRRITFDQTGLPPAAGRLLAMLPAEAQASVAARRPARLVESVGRWTLATWSDARDFTRLIGETTLRTLPAVRGRTRTRAADLVACIHDAGIAALPMVALVNLLVGGIVAFVGSLQLSRFGARIYVSDLIGVMEIREMAPLITAIVMSGRTGSAYAAEIAAMQGTDEIDALRAIGISLFDYLILPRVSALAAMMPFLCVYAGFIGIAGGFAVAVSVMNLPWGGFAAHLRGAVGMHDLILGLSKSVAFGAWIGLSGCRIGLRAGRSATDVGAAATRAAVSGIVGVIALDALFDVCANAVRV
jgi:phospholipid/cholesterol/gamma-HCH transport system permease protein